MEKAMRRKDRAVSREEALEALRQGEYGVLSTIGPDGELYGVPLSYALLDEAVYFHCAREGRKLDNLACGDFVNWERQAQGNAAITKLLPRHNVLERPDFRGIPRAIAANKSCNL